MCVRACVCVFCRCLSNHGCRVIKSSSVTVKSSPASEAFYYSSSKLECITAGLNAEQQKWIHYCVPPAWLSINVRVFPDMNRRSNPAVIDDTNIVLLQSKWFPFLVALLYLWILDQHVLSTDVLCLSVFFCLVLIGGSYVRAPIITSAGPLLSQPFAPQKTGSLRLLSPTLATFKYYIDPIISHFFAEWLFFPSFASIMVAPCQARLWRSASSLKTLSHFEKPL